MARLEAVADLRTKQVGNWLVERVTQARFLSTGPYFSQLYARWRDQGDSAARDMFTARLVEFRKTSGAATALVVDRSGEVVFRETGARGVPAPEVLAAVRRALETGELQHTNLYPGPGTDAPAVRLDVVAPLLGRSLAGRAANAPLELLPPQQFYDDRINLLEIRVGKIVRFGGRRVQVSLDMFNVLNSSTLLNANANYSPTGTWEIPTQIPGGRLMKVTGQFDF